MILLIDNYDSFVFNLARYVEELGVETRVVRNDAITVDGIRRAEAAGHHSLPGTLRPARVRRLPRPDRRLGPSIPILGVCLGHQAIAHVLGGEVVGVGPARSWTRLPRHPHRPRTLCRSPESRSRWAAITRWSLRQTALPPDLEITAQTDDGVVMALEHRTWPLLAVQFHPESILTVGGHQLLANFLTAAGCRVGAPRGATFRPTRTRPTSTPAPVDWP